MTSTFDTRTPALAQIDQGETKRTLFAPEDVIQAYPGPAFLAAHDGGVLFANAQASDLVAALRDGTLDDLPESVADVYRGGGATTEMVTLPHAMGGGTLDLTLVPAATAGTIVTGVMVFGRNVTLENNLRNALVESRQRYKDLVDCSSDFAWETGCDGRFVFVSPGGVLGFHPDQLIGRKAGDFVVPELEAPSRLPFDSDQPAVEAIIWMRSADGGAACLKVSSLPLFDPDGEWSGARGISRDITASRAKDLALAVARRREQTLDSILRAMRNEVVISAMFEAATRAIVDALDLSACWVLRLDDKNKAYVAVAEPDGAVVPEQVLRQLQTFADGTDSGIAAMRNIDGTLIAPSQYAKSVNGGVAVVRAHGAEWNDDDRDLLAGVAGQLGIAIEQASNHEKLELLSRTDSLTGLLNRRAFTDEAGRRMSLAIRNGRRAALLYIDLDNFKAINDHHGHGPGDEALLKVAAYLNDGSRGSDVLARVGGDEFALWLDDAGDSGGEIKAKALADTDALSAAVPAVEGHPFGLSIGLANFDPDSNESLDSLMERADHAMYIAKRDHGRSSYHVANAQGLGEGDADD